MPQDFADMLGWRELAEKTENIFYLSLPDSVRSRTVVYCRHYGQAGALKFYARHDYFKNRVFSDNGSFLLWISDSLTFNHLLFVGRLVPDKDDEVFNHFHDRLIMDSVTNPLSRQYGDLIILYRDADDSAALLARQGLEEMKNRFRR